MKCHDISPNAQHAAALAHTTTLEDNALNILSRLGRLTRLATVLGIALSLLTVAAHAEEQAGTINVNTATMEELQLLPGVGPTTAKNIHYLIHGDHDEAGALESCSELVRAKGIGEKRLAQITPYCATTGETTLTEKPGSKAKESSKIAAPDDYEG